MNDDASRTFRTHHGTCTVTPTRLILRKDADSEDDEWVDTMTTQSAKPGGPYHRLNIILSVAFIVVGVIFAVMGDIFVALCAIGGGVLFFLIARRDRTRGAVQSVSIERSTIRSVTAEPPAPHATRGAFTVAYETEGKIHERQIVLPAGDAGGAAEWEKALRIMRDEGMMSEAAR